MKKSFDFLDDLIASGVEFNAAKPDVMKKFGVDINGATTIVEAGKIIPWTKEDLSEVLKQPTSSSSNREEKPQSQILSRDDYMEEDWMDRALREMDQVPEPPLLED